MDDTDGDDIYCPSCGESLAPSDYFCPQCGAENERADGPPPEVARSRREPTEGTGTEHGGGPVPAENDGWTADDRGRSPQSGSGMDGGDRREGRGRQWDPDGPRRGRRGERTRGRQGPRRPPESTREGRGWAPPGAPGSMREREPGWKPILVGIGLAALSIILLLLFTVLSVPIVTIFNLSTGAALIVGAAFGQYFGFFGLALAHLRRRGYDWQGIREYLGVRFPSLKELGIVIVGWLAILALAIVIGIIVQFLPVEGAENESANQLAEGASGNSLLIFGVFALMFLVVGPCEEILYRGVIQNRIRERYSKVPAIAAASVIFASVHVVALGATDPLAVLTSISILTVTALVLGTVYEFTGNLVVPWLLHSVHNSIIFTTVFFGPDAESALLVPKILALVGL